MAETIRGLNIKLGLDISEIDAALKELNKDLKSQAQDLRAINTALRYDSSNVELWTKKQTTLNQTLENTKQKLIAQNQKLEEAKRAVQLGAMSEDEFNRLSRGIIYTEGRLSRLNNELETTKKRILDLGNARWDNLVKLGSSLSKRVTAPLVALSAALSALTIKSMSTASEIAINAEKANLTVESYQQWAHASNSLSVDLSRLQRAFVKTNSLLGDIASGNGEKYNSSLAQIGLTIKDIEGLSTDEAFLKIRDSLASIEDAALRTSAANSIFGERLGSDLIPILNVTSAEIINLRKEAADLGIITSSQAELAKDFTTELSNLKRSLQGVTYELAVEVVPLITRVLDLIKERLIPAIKSLTEKWRNLSKPTKTIIVSLLGVAAAIGPILIAVGKLIPMIKTITTAIKAMDLANKMSSVGWGALVAILAIFLLQNERFRKLLADIINSLGRVLDVVIELVNNITSAIMPLLEVVISLIEDIVNVIVDILIDTLDPLMVVIDLIINLIKGLIPVIEEMTNNLTNLLIPIIKIIRKILPPIVSIIEIVIDLIIKIVEAITGLVETVLKTVINIISVVGEILGVIIDLIAHLIEIIGNILEPVLKIIVAVLEPILEIISVIISLVSMVMELLAPLIDALLQPLFIMLSAILEVISFLAPALKVVADIIEKTIVPVLEVLFTILEPILNIINKIMDAIKWLIDGASSIFSWIGDKIGSVSGWFSDAFNISGASAKTTNNNTNNTTTNNITVHTTSPTIDIDALNRKLGGSYI